MTNEVKKRSVSPLKIMVILVIFVAVLADAAYLYVNAGHAKLRQNAETVEPVIQQTEAVTTKEAVKWQDGWVKYNGGIYAYKENLMSFLVMGIDKNLPEKVDEQSLEGGQADVLVLLVLDPDEKRIDMIPINRNSMVDVDVFDADGRNLYSQKAQIAVQHGVGDGLEKSCEYQVNAVSKLFYQLPIHGYAALNMEGIIPLNDAVGGVDVVVPENYDSGEYTFTEGETVHLEGEQAYIFLRDRDNEVGGADRRLSRHEAYLTALVGKVYNEIKNDPLSFMSVYNAISQYTVSNISSSELAYLATEASGFSYDEDSVHEIKGSTVKGELYDEFYIDDDALEELIMDVFYKKIE
jgi:LCP family protein required for cell wall assembly